MQLTAEGAPVAPTDLPAEAPHSARAGNAMPTVEIRLEGAVRTNSVEGRS